MGVEIPLPTNSAPPQGQDGSSKATPNSLANSSKTLVGSLRPLRSKGTLMPGKANNGEKVCESPPLPCQFIPLLPGHIKPKMCGPPRPEDGGQQPKFLGRMQKRNIVHLDHRLNAICPRAPPDSCGVDDKGSEKLICRRRPADKDQFHKAIDLLNSMIEADARKFDMREWVIRHAEGRAGAQLSKEQLQPVWILVGSDFVLAVDLNGSAQHRNYSDVAALQLEQFPPEGAIVFPLEGVLKTGELRLPQTSTGVKAMNVLLRGESRWGAPIGVLFMSPSDQSSIIQDICQSYLPSFLRSVYPMGVQLRGEWISTVSSSEVGEFRVAELPQKFRDGLHLSMAAQGTSGTSSLTGEGYRISDVEVVQSLGKLDSTELHGERKTNVEMGSSPSFNLKNQQQEMLSTTSQASKPPPTNPPWEGGGRGPLFSGRLHTLQSVPPKGSPTTFCHGVLLLTARGPLELLPEGTTSHVRIKDVKLSFLRSGVGRCMRLTQESVRFMYVPSGPVLSDNHVVDTRYAVLRLQTHK